MPITRPIDTLVLGGGMAGTFAALAAKTPDTTVAIVEPANVLGGQGTAGGVAGF
ncbi:MAG: FAD-dependent oxidoreductase, partial [Gemmatimonadetes bacterium]|nr:FAD-dependent oxidoreductase [Gemmatimonadota bacterium]